MNAVRRLEVTDNGVQFRLSRSPSLYTDFHTNINGNQLILPSSGRVAINQTENPSHTLTINGNLRIRSVPPVAGAPESILIGRQIGAIGADREVRRLNFTGNSSDVLLGNGTWGTAPVGFAFCGLAVASTQDLELNLGGNNLYILGSSSTDNLALGWPCGTVVKAKVDVNKTSGGIGGSFQVSGSGPLPIGVLGQSSGGALSTGVLGSAFGSGTNFGIYGQAGGGSTNWAGFFEGDIWVQNTGFFTNGTQTISDVQFKTNINDLTGAISIINQLSPRTFYFDTVNYTGFGFESDEQMGLVAQEVEQVLPSLVSTSIRPAQYDSLGVETTPAVSYKALEYEELIPLLIGGMQEQQQLIDSLNNRLTDLEDCLSNIPGLCNNQGNGISMNNESNNIKSNDLNVELSDKYNIVLNQNVPNPFAEKTVISYSIPQEFTKAQVLFYDSKGMLINSIDIIEKGDGQLNVFANDLSTGLYTYTLVVDNKVIATKKMMKN